MIRLERFNKADYPALISWVKSEEELMQFGGPGFSFPLTAEQLDKSMEDKNRAAFSVIDTETNEHIGHAEIYLTETTAKLGRILIGNEQKRGNGFGKDIVKALIEFVFHRMDRNIIELNVFDWNASAIRCDEKVGFKINPGKTLERKVKGQTWIALNMILDMEQWNMKNK